MIESMLDENYEWFNKNFLSNQCKEYIKWVRFINGAGGFI